MKKLLGLICMLPIILVSCTREDLTLQIIRNPLIKFNTDSSSWKAENYFFTGPATVVVYPSNPLLPGVIYNRYLLQATGKDSKGNNLQFNLAFDAADNSRLTGVYKIGYTAERGLQQAQLYTLGSTLTAFALCTNDTLSPILTIEKQSIDERLITGRFQMTLCNTRDTAQKIKISNGVITDIRY